MRSTARRHYDDKKTKRTRQSVCSFKSRSANVTGSSAANAHVSLTHLRQRATTCACCMSASQSCAYKRATATATATLVNFAAGSCRRGGRRLRLSLLAHTAARGGSIDEALCGSLTWRTSGRRVIRSLADRYTRREGWIESERASFPCFCPRLNGHLASEREKSEDRRHSQTDCE